MHLQNRAPEFRLPSPPSVLAEIVHAASDPETSVVKLGKLTSHDPAFAAELLRVSNSPLYRRGPAVTSVMRAVAVLGARGLRNMALCAAARNCVDPRELGEFNLGRYWEDSLRRGVASQLLAERLDIGDPMEAFTTGLLQDLGVLGLILTQPSEALQWMAALEQSPGARRNHENEVFGCSHDELGRQLAEHWALPAELADPLCHHHDPDHAPVESADACRLAGWAEIVANVFTATDRGAALEHAREILQCEAGIELAAVDELIASVSGRVEEAARTFQLSIGTQPSFEELVVATNRGLTELTGSYEELVRQLEDALTQLEATLADRALLARQLEERNRELERLTLTDPLTGLPNRRACWQRLADEVTRIARHAGSLSVILIDIDHFKRCNDDLGHEFGDHVLQAVSVTMSDVVRQSDLVARIGGEEFLVVLPETDGAGAAVVARKLLTAISMRAMEPRDGPARRVTISGGLTTLSGPHAAAWELDDVLARLYRCADEALYAAKDGGRNRVCTSAADATWVV